MDSSLGTALVGVLIVAVTVAASVLGMHWVRKRLTHSVLQENNEVAGYIVGVLGMIYAVLLAFVVIAVWEIFRDAEERVEQEANHVSSLYWIANTLPESVREQVWDALERYLRAVVDEEWRLMEQGETSPAAVDGYLALWRLAASPIALVDPQHVEGYSQYLDLVEQLGSARRLRLVSNAAKLPPILWVVLIFGAVLNIGFTFLFAQRNARHQAVMIGSLAAMIGASLFLIMVLEHPFRGLAEVRPAAFQTVLEQHFSSPSPPGP